MATKSSVTGAPVGLAGAVGERYGLGTVVLKRALAGGYANDVYLAEADGEALVLRVQRAPLDLRGLAWEHQLVRRLAERLPEVPAPLAGRDGATFFELGDATVSVIPYRGGVPADRADPLHRQAAAALLGRFHHAATPVRLGQRPGATSLARLRPALESGRYFRSFGSREHALPEALERRRGEIRAAREWMLEFLERASLAEPVEALVHGDYFPGNVLILGARPTALLDWEEARVDWAALDLANGMWEFCESRDGGRLDGGAAATFARAYRAAGGVVPAEEEPLLVPLVRVRRILELLRACYFDRDVDWDYQARNLDAFWNLG